ncbi:MAG: SprB repeat-containing protein, partial [Bacteroidota bacterium]|nr:SprB repeat-containing protein [Bacteroidota bacterium]
MRIFIFLSLTVFLALATTKAAFSDNRYWVNGSGNWNDPQQWSETSGGTPGASVPTKNDDVFFDHHSFTSNNQSVIIKEIAYCNDFRWEVDNYQPTLKSSSFLFKKWTKAEIHVYGSLLINENVNHAFFGDIILKSDKESTIEVDSKLTADLIIDAERGAYILNSDYNSDAGIYLKSGEFNTKNNKIFAESFIASGNNKRIMNLGNSEVEVREWNFAASDNLDFNAGESEILIRNNDFDKSVKLGGLDYNKLSKSGAKSAFSFDLEQDSVICNGEENGKIVATITSGGTSPFLYELKDGYDNVISSSGFTNDLTWTFENLKASTYLVKITDTDGTWNARSESVLEPDPLVLTIDVAKGLTCFDGNDAELEAIVSGGTEPYSYYWEVFDTVTSTWGPLGQTTKIVTNISQGIYRVYIDDANSCGTEYVNKYFTNPPDDVNIPEEIIFDNISKTNSCQGADNGTITLEALGGTGDIDYYLIRLSDMLVIPAGPPYDEDGYFTGLQPDTYETYAIDENGCTKQGNDVEIEETTNPTADAGTGGDECNLDFTLNANPSVGIGTWTSSGPGNASFSPNANDPNATVTVDAYGSYDFTWTEDNDGCIDYDQITVNFYEQPVADAGTGGDECGLDFLLNATPSVGTGTWTYTGPGTANFAPDANDPNATVTVDTYGSYDFTWTEDNNGCIDSDQITVNFYEQPVADAGPGGSVCGFDFGLSATPSVGTGTWTYSGPGTASFAPDANDPNATATVDAYGSYTFTWTEMNGTCSDDDNVVVDYLETPVADAGSGGDECDFDFVLNANPSV